MFALALVVTAFIFYRFSFDNLAISEHQKRGLTLTHFLFFFLGRLLLGLRLVQVGIAG